MFQPLLRTSNLLGVYWTLYVEMLFYILMSLLWVTTKFKNIENTLIIGLVIAFGINGIYLITGSYNLTFQKLFIITRSILPIISHFQSFSAGIIFYLFYTIGVNKKGVLILLFSIISAAVTHTITIWIADEMTVLEHVVCILVFYLGFILLIKHKLIFFKAKLFKVLGDISYPLYLVHQLFSLTFVVFMSPVIGYATSTILGILLSILLSLVIAYWYDIPIRKRIYKMLIKNTSIASQQSS
jgi:peptidoglycan/LPS O-acetylase OafA/YrhL